MSSEDILKTGMSEVDPDISIRLTGNGELHRVAEGRNVQFGERSFGVGFWATEECPAERHGTFTSRLGHDFNNCTLCVFPLTFVQSINKCRDPLPGTLSGLLQLLQGLDNQLVELSCQRFIDQSFVTADLLLNEIAVTRKPNRELVCDSGEEVSGVVSPIDRKGECCPELFSSLDFLCTSLATADLSTPAGPSIQRIGKGVSSTAGIAQCMISSMYCCRVPGKHLGCLRAEESCAASGTDASSRISLPGEKC